MDLLSPEAAARAKQLEFFARTRVDGFLKGANRSARKGSSTDFRQHRPYVAGDDLRHLDWRLFARSDRLVTREYEEYTNLDVILAVDASGSMGFGHPSKLEFAQHCAALFAYLLNLQRDRIALACLNHKLTQYLAPSGGRKHLAALFTQLSNLTSTGETDFAAAIRQLASRVRRKSVFVFFSDCYQDPEALTRAIGMLSVQGHDVLLYQIHDPAETDLVFPGFTIFRDLESDQLDSVDPMEIRKAYQDVFQNHLRLLKEGTGKYGIEFHSFRSDDDWDDALARLLHLRLRRQ